MISKEFFLSLILISSSGAIADLNPVTIPQVVVPPTIPNPLPKTPPEIPTFMKRLCRFSEDQKPAWIAQEKWEEIRANAKCGT